MMGKASSARFEGEGLEGIVVARTEICFIDGARGILRYRGHDIHDLARHATYEEVVHLLFHGQLPKAAELAALRRSLADARALPPEVVDLLRNVPKSAHPMDVLRTAVSLLGLTDPTASDVSLDAVRAKSLRLVAQFATIVATFERFRRGLSPIAPDPKLSHAANLLWMLRGTAPPDLETRIVDCALVLHAEHDFNASTFAGRVSIATLTDIYSAITAAVGTLKGPLHGGANEGVMRALDAIGTVAKVRPWVEDQFAAKNKIMGFGHRVYKVEDPRATHLRTLSRELGERRGDTRLYDMSIAMEQAVKELKGLPPNVDFYSATVYHALGIPLDLFTPIFALSRIAGWCAHVQEQLAANRLIRPLSEYVGSPPMPWIPIEKR